MANDLTEADLVDFEVAFTDGNVRNVRGVYVSADGATGLLAIKDHRHKHVLLTRPEAVQYIGRLGSSEPGSGTGAGAPRTAVWRCDHGTAIAGPDYVPRFRGPCGCEMQPARPEGT